MPINDPAADAFMPDKQADSASLVQRVEMIACIDRSVADGLRIGCSPGEPRSGGGGRMASQAGGATGPVRCA